MSREFLTYRDARVKLGITPAGDSNEFVTKEQLLAMGAKEELLSKYGNGEFVVDDDIVLPELPLLFEYSGTSNGDNIKSLPRAFNPSKPFKITGEISFSSISGGVGTGFIIYTYGGAGQDINGKLDITLWGDAAQYDLNINTKKSDNVWISCDQKKVSLNTFYPFDLDYDGTTYKRRIGISAATDVVRLVDFECYSICFTGSPWWSGRSCTATIRDFIIRQ